MQTLTDIAIYQTVVAALVIQFAMMIINKKARDAYISDIVHFRRSKGTLSKYYGWRISNIRNAIVDAVVYLTILVSIILGIAYFSNVLTELIEVIVIVVFVLGLAGLSSIQLIWRVKKVNEQELVLISDISSADYMIGRAQAIVNDLYETDTKDDGHIWFALFKIAQMENSLGYSVRDVLLEKGEEVVRESQKQRVAKQGPEISDDSESENELE